MYTIRLADGLELTGLRMNGTNYVSKDQVDENIFVNNLTTMTVSDGDTETVYHDVELIQQVHYEDGWYLSFRELSDAEKTAIATEDSITDVQLALAEIYEMMLGGM